VYEHTSPEHCAKFTATDPQAPADPPLQFPADGYTAPTPTGVVVRITSYTIVSAWFATRGQITAIELLPVDL
jgi:hypothetical protein